jgi:type III secretion protein T
MSPFLGGGTLSGQLKAGLIFSFALILAPVWIEQVPFDSPLNVSHLPLLIGLALKELALGFILTWAVALVFYMAMSAGFIMDNQRGATMASEQDPYLAEETSPLGSLFFQSLVYVFFVGGGLMTFLPLFFDSYVIWPVLSFWPNLASQKFVLFALNLADWLMLNAVLVAGPLAAVCLLTDAALGLINRFASQLNVYVLAMPIKSAITMFILVSYYLTFLRLSPGFWTEMFQKTPLLRLILLD